MTNEAFPYTANRRRQRRAAIDAVLSVVTLLGFSIAWLTGGLSIWFPILGVLLVSQAVGYVAFTRLMARDPSAWRRDWLPLVMLEVLWCAAFDADMAQLSTIVSLLVTGFTILVIGLSAAMFFRLQKRRSSR